MKKYTIIMILAFVLINSVTSVYGLETDDVKIHGFLSQGYLKTDHNNYLADTEDGTFQFNEFGINFTAPLTDNLRVGMQFFGRDLGPKGNDEVVLDWAFLDYRLKDWFGLRVGKMKLDYGLYNEVREMDMLRTSVMLPQSVYIELWRDSFSSIKGLGFYGSTQENMLGSLSYSFQFGSLNFDSDGGFASAWMDVLSPYNYKMKYIDSDYTYTWGVTWDTPVNGLKSKFSFFEIRGLEHGGEVSGKVPYDLNKDGIISPGEGLPVSSLAYEYMVQRGYALSIEYTLGNFLLAAEYAEGDVHGRINLGYGFQKRPPAPSRGWYVAGSYRFSPLFSMEVSYSDYVPVTDDEDGDKIVATGGRDFEAWQKTWTISTRFDLNEHFIFKLETSYNDGFGAYDSMKNLSSDLEQYWWLFAAKATVRF